MGDIRRLLEIMAKLRNPDGGCPWDLEQDFATIAPHTIEEAYEVDDAIRRESFDDLRDELGDLLLQVVFHAQMAREERHFDFGDVVDAICDKLVRRHPHVFGDARIEDAAAQTNAWERQKAEERADRGETSLADGVSLGLPALLRAKKLIGRAARAGFAWPAPEDAAEKVDEELAEVRAEMVAGDRGGARQAEEIGDLLLAVVGLAQSLDVNPETSLRESLARFEARLRRVEAGLADEGRAIADADAGELTARYDAAKKSLSV
jgi:MazG family protein